MAGDVNLNPLHHGFQVWEMHPSLKFTRDKRIFVRENRNFEKKHLPGSVYEEWLSSQHTAPDHTRHKAPVPDVYEAWVEKRVREKASGARHTKG
jgi:hypothetical protein